MSEWPKIWPGVDSYVREAHDMDEPKSVEVIPADLGRELYEVLKKATTGTEGYYDFEVRNALARYEREVGK